MSDGIDYQEFASEGRVLEGTIALSQCDRLVDLVENPETEVHYRLAFSFDDQRRVVINSEVKARLSLICQRCNKSLLFDLESSSALSPVTSDAAAKALPKRYEPFMLLDDEMQLIDIIEEELLLALPMVPRHEQPSCAEGLSEYLK